MNLEYGNTKEGIARDQRPSARRYLVPILIILTGAAISVAILFARITTGGTERSMSPLGKTPFTFTPSSPNSVRKVDGSDHILGNPNAPIKIIEFSDFECPFCKLLHISMGKVMEVYGKDGKVAWVYRHLPLDEIHTKARTEAVAAECAGEIGGNTAFWKYAGRVFEVTLSNDGLDLSLLPKIAQEFEIDQGAFEKCLASGKYDGHIEADRRDAISSGAKGTPYIVVVTSDGQAFPLSGVQAYSTISSLLDLILKKQQ